MPRFTPVICALLLWPSPSWAATLAGEALSIEVEDTTVIHSVVLGGWIVDSGLSQLYGSCIGSTPTAPVVVSGTTATYSVTCGSFAVDATVRLLSAVPGTGGNLQPVSGGFEQTFEIMNPTAGTLVFAGLGNKDLDLLTTVNDDTVEYDAATGAVFGYDTVADPDVLVATIAHTDYDGAVLGWDVDKLDTLDYTFPMDNGIGPVGSPEDVGMTIGYEIPIQAGETAVLKLRTIYVRSTTEVPAPFDFSSCYVSPIETCRTGTKSSLAMKFGDRNSVKWKFAGGQATTLDDISDPTSDRGYSICVYDSTNARFYSSHIQPSSTKWVPNGTSGYKYKDKEGTSFGMTKAVVAAGIEGRTKLQLAGAGATLPDPLFFGGISTPVKVQVHGGNPGVCFESSLTTVVKNEVDELKLK